MLFVTSQRIGILSAHAQEMLKLCIDYDRALSQSFIDTWIKQERENNDYL